MTDKPESYVSVTRESIKDSHIQELRDALEFYANAKNWAASFACSENHVGRVPSAIEVDFGKRARLALGKD